MDRSPQVTGLESLLSRGALQRQHFHLQSARAAFPAAAVACALAVGIYVLVLLLAGRTDWINIAFVAASAALIPLIAISLLILSARRTYPFTMSLAVMVFAASLTVALVSATRVPVSYFGLLLTLPSSLFFVTVANIAMVRQLRRRVAILRFPGAEEIVARAGWPIPIVERDDVTIPFRRILIDPATHHTDEWTSHLVSLYLRGIEIEAWPTYLETLLGKVDLSSFDLAHISYTSSQIFYYRLKRAIDLAGVVVLGIPAILICAAVWIYIRIIDGRPSLFVQERRGYGGAMFRLYKFRTMYKGDHVGSTAAGDKRIMPGCRLLRQLRVDELPQLYNIFKGEMSFIGPRPLPAAVSEALQVRNPLHSNRYILLPGLTGWAQINQGYAETEEEELEKLAYDLYYLKNVSLDLDIIIAFRTVQTVLLRLGAR